LKLASTDHREVFSLRLTGYYLAQGPVFGFDRGYADSNSPTIIVQGKAAARTVHYILTVGSADPYRASTEGFVQQLADSASPRISSSSRAEDTVGVSSGAGCCSVSRSSSRSSRRCRRRPTLNNNDHPFANRSSDLR